MQKLNRDQMAARVARDIPEGAYVNLGIRLPTLVANHLPKDREIFLHPFRLPSADNSAWENFRNAWIGGNFQGYVVNRVSITVST